MKFSNHTHLYFSLSKTFSTRKVLFLGNYSNLKKEPVENSQLYDFNWKGIIKKVHFVPLSKAKRSSVISNT